MALCFSMKASLTLCDTSQTRGETNKIPKNGCRLLPSQFVQSQEALHRCQEAFAAKRQNPSATKCTLAFIIYRRAQSTNTPLQKQLHHQELPIAMQIVLHGKASVSPNTNLQGRDTGNGVCERQQVPNVRFDAKQGATHLDFRVSDNIRTRIRPQSRGEGKRGSRRETLFPPAKTKQNTLNYEHNNTNHYNRSQAGRIPLAFVDKY